MPTDHTADRVRSDAAPLAARIASLSPERRELLQRILDEQGSRYSIPVPKERKRDNLPLSFAQQRLWFLEQLGAAGPGYHLGRRLRLRGELNRGALVRALDRMVERHETLRTTFTQKDGVPQQQIAPAGQSRFQLVEHDLVGEAEAERTLRRLSAEEFNARFDFERGPLLRGRLIRMGQDDHVLLLTLHHIVSDGWSMGVLVRELSALYGAYQRGEPDPLPALPLQYADYAAWQREWVTGALLEAQASYWKETLAGAPELLELPTDRPRAARQDYAGASLRVELAEELTAGLKELSRRHGTTLYMTVLAGWAVVLSRLAGQAEVVIGTPVANRGRREIEGLIGFFVNTLALRVDLSGEPSVAELLGRVKTRTIEAQQNQDISFEQVVERVQPVRSLAHTPLFQVMFAWQNAPNTPLAFPGLINTAAPKLADTVTKFDLSVALGEANGCISGALNYATALFDRSTAERYVGYLRQALEAMVADDAQVVDRLHLLRADEQTQVIQGWNDTLVQYSEDSAADLFEAQAQRTPDAVAIVRADVALSYRELNERANRLAHELRSRGVGPDVRVALCLERSVEMVIAVLGVLKAGGAYVPLDPAYPEERLDYVLEDSGSALLLTQSGRADRAGKTPTLELDRQTSTWAARPAGNPDRTQLRPNHLAYVIYTSGSTGRPKGVLVEQANLTNHTRWQCERFPLCDRDVVLQKTTLSFDVSIWELLWPLVSGARLVLARPGGQGDLPYLLEILHRERITQLHFVPSMLQLFLEAEGIGDGLSLQRLVCGGEELNTELAQHARVRLPQVELYNMYGPTETTITATGRQYTTTECGRIVSIGGPVPNTRTYVLDHHGEAVPVGVVGELYIGGAQVARGYAGRPALTAERFVADAFSGVEGARLYRTGDRCRWRADGTLEYVGRADQQVKIRGFRIEPAEIEARLREHVHVRTALVVACEHAGGDRRLVAYWSGDASVGADALRAHLRERLPEHMLPSAFVQLDALPLLPSGKVDRGTLPAPDFGAYETKPYDPPGGALEETFAHIWTDVLGVQRVGRHDNFFELGGHSLLAIRLIDRLRKASGLNISLAHIFSHPTIADLCSAMITPKIEDASAAIPVRPGGSKLPLFFVHEGTGSTAYARALGAHIEGDVPIYSLPAAGRAEPALRTVESMAARLLAMIRAVQPNGPYRIAGWSFGGVLAYEIVAQLLGQDEAVEFLGLLDSHHPADPRTHNAASSKDRLVQHALLLESDTTEAKARELRSRLELHGKALLEYRPGSLPFPVHIFPAQESNNPDPTRGWRTLIPEPLLRVTPVPGTHLSMMQPPNAAALGAALERQMVSVARDAPARIDVCSPLIKLERGRTDAARLFCVPGAGASITSFIDLCGALSSSQWAIHGLQPRGIDGAWPPHTSVAAAAECYLRSIVGLFPEGDIHLLGHSFGGWIAFEMALRLRAAGGVIASLTIVDSDVPDDDPIGHEYTDREAFLKYVEVVELSSQKTLGIRLADVDESNEHARLRLLHEAMVRCGLLSGRSTPDVLSGPFRAFAACVRTAYRPSGVYPGRVRLVLVKDPRLTDDTNLQNFAAATRGWQQWAPNLVFSSGAGDHFTILKSPNVNALALYLASDRAHATERVATLA